MTAALGFVEKGKQGKSVEAYAKVLAAILKCGLFVPKLMRQRSPQKSAIGPI
jgi:hypothetical protein